MPTSYYMNDFAFFETTNSRILLLIFVRTRLYRLYSISVFYRFQYYSISVLQYCTDFMYFFIMDVLKLQLPGVITARKMHQSAGGRGKKYN